MSIQVVATSGSVVSGQPVSPNAIWTQTTTLEGTTFFLTFQYNQRTMTWSLSVADSENIDIVNGIKLVCGISLLRKCVDPRKPAGALMVLSATADASPPGLSDLLPGAGRCTLYYITSDWVAQLGTPAGVANLQAQLAAQTQTGTASTYGSSA